MTLFEPFDIIRNIHLLKIIVKKIVSLYYSRLKHDYSYKNRIIKKNYFKISKQLILKFIANRKDINQLCLTPIYISTTRTKMYSNLSNKSALLASFKGTGDTGVKGI